MEAPIDTSLVLDRGLVARALVEAVTAAGGPSIHNIQAWHWRERGGGADLYAEPRRQMTIADPDRRLLTLSRGRRPPQGHTAGERRGAATSSPQQDELHDQATCAELVTAGLLTLAQLLLEPLKQPPWISAITPIINQMTTTTTERRNAGSSGTLNAGRLRDGARRGCVPPG